MSSPVECVCFVVVLDNKVLFEHRFYDGLQHSRRINIPGGHIEKGESKEQTLIREVNEELGVIPLSYGFLGSKNFESISKQLLHYYLLTDWEGEIKAKEGQELEWLYPCEGLEINSADQEILMLAGLWKTV